MVVISFQEAAEKLKFKKQFHEEASSLASSFVQLHKDFDSFSEINLSNGAFAEMCLQISQMPDYAIQLLAFRVSGQLDNMKLSISSTLHPNAPSFFDISAELDSSDKKDSSLLEFAELLTNYLQDTFEFEGNRVPYGEVEFPYFSVLCGVYNWISSSPHILEVNRREEFFEFIFKENLVQVGTPEYKIHGYLTIQLNLNIMKQSCATLYKIGMTGKE